ncbi:ONAC010 protein [Hibiscus syriacus]|uniref:ONAC010 protein n=1 Tax=Hibiscus syriacus TaxID=106335 RepID=A0A6A2YES4_HIBSY|nr:NAC domain-containing protein 83-like [Hibiscus syriacus]KAE8672987.1 ONAC010 protein [Hibiscus syriacus]
MEKLNFVKDGVLKLPPGFRFHPTDEELVVQYLRRKVLAWPLPASVIPEVDVCKADPWELPGDLEQERYFFSTREAKYPNGNRSNRATLSGYWKATGIDKQIATCRGNRVVGMKKTLVFYRGKPPKGTRTDWIMHEYRLLSAETAACNVVAVENWVLCRVFLKKRRGGSTKNEKEVPTKARALSPVFYDFMTKERTGLNLASSSSSSCSSGITQASNNETDDREESSTCNSFPYFRRKT